MLSLTKLRKSPFLAKRSSRKIRRVAVMIQQESCFLAHLRNWCAHQELVYIIYIYIQYPHQFAWICPNTTRKHVHTPSLTLTATVDLQIISRSFHLSPKKEHQNAEFWKQLSLSHYTNIYIYTHVYFHPLTNDPTSHHLFTLDFALYSPQHNYLTGLRTGSCGTPRLVLH